MGKQATEKALKELESAMLYLPPSGAVHIEIHLTTAIAALKEAISKSCPNGECTDKSQCWEPCGDLGHSEEHCTVSTQAVLKRATPAGYLPISVGLLERVEESLGSFCSDLGWGQADMDVMDSVSAVLAAK
jgi:hypothetical protein